MKDTLSTIESGKTILERLSELKKIATELKDEGITVKLSYKGDIILTAGLDAKPAFSSIITRTNAIEINNLLKLIKLAV